VEATEPRSHEAIGGRAQGAGRRALPPIERDLRAARRLKHGCCSATDAIDARAISGKLGMPFYALNFERDFDRIIQYFVDEYAQARTPNPCVMCNIHVKFGKLLRYADMMDAEFIATGHYARVLRARGTGNGEQGAEKGRGTQGERRGGAAAVQAVPRDSDAPSRREARGGGLTEFGATPTDAAAHTLCRSLNHAKDQSYVLFGIRRADLPRCLFPLGEMTDKGTVRQIAADLGLRVHDKPDSQEICFVPNNDYKQLVHERVPATQQAGPVIDADGNVLGRHDGISGFTIGQRRGLGIAAGKPIYVTKLSVLDNTVTVGPKADLLSATLVATDMNWLVDWPHDAIRGHVKIRHMHPMAAATFRKVDERTVEAHFDEPQLAVTPGQAAVFYQGDVVYGGGWIGEKGE
jgi:tRNA-specific 2-thiouridylase